jgi:hypothetical protein
MGHHRPRQESGALETRQEIVSIPAHGDLRRPARVTLQLSCRAA